MLANNFVKSEQLGPDVVSKNCCLYGKKCRPWSDAAESDQGLPSLLWLVCLNIKGTYGLTYCINSCHILNKDAMPTFNFQPISSQMIKVVDTNSNTGWQTVQIQISWFLQKLTDLDLHYLQMMGISGQQDKLR